MRRIIISLILLVGFCSGTYPIYFKHIGMQEGLSQLSVMAIYQDNLGRMWFGTEEGISIYDGVQTKAYKPSEFHRQNANPIGNQTHFIAGDKDGNVFFDSDQSLIRYDIQTQKFSCLRKSNVYINPAKRKAMAVKNEKRFLKQKRNALKNPGYSHHPVKTQASFKRLLKAV